MKLLPFLRSMKLTAFLISLLGILLLAGLWIPQKSLLTGEMYEQWRQNSPGTVALLESAGLTDVYAAPVTMAVWACFFVNLTFVMAQRITGIVARIKPDPGKMPAVEASGGRYRRRLLLSDSTRDDFYDEMRRNGYTIFASEDRFFAIRNRLSPVATILFHLSFYLILVGAVISNYTKFSGMVNLAEGETFTGDIREYAAPPRHSKVGEPPRIGFTVVKVVPEVQGVTSTALTVTVRDEQGTVREMGINRPYKKGAVSCVIKNLGISPLMVLSSEGKEVDGAYVKLNVLKGKTDQFHIGPYQVRARFFPDYENIDGEETTKTEEFRNPVLHLQAYRDGRLAGEGRVKPGESLMIGTERLEFREMPFWVAVAVVREHGLEILYIGFLLAVVGLVWRFGAYRREIIGRWQYDGTTPAISIAGRADFYQALTEEEFDTMFSGMKCVTAIE